MYGDALVPDVVCGNITPTISLMVLVMLRCMTNTANNKIYILL